MCEDLEHPHRHAATGARMDKPLMSPSILHSLMLKGFAICV